MIKIGNKRRKKKRKLKKSVVIAIIIITLIAVVSMFFNSLDNINNVEDKEKEENQNLAELTSPEKAVDTNVYEKYDCEEISKEYIDNNMQVKLTFNKNLFDKENNSNEKYFEELIEDLVNSYDTNFTLIDEEKDIIIEVNIDSNKEYTYTVNSIENYFQNAKEENKLLENYKEIKTVKADITNKDFNKFATNSWSVTAANVKIQNKGEDYLDYENYKVITDNTYIKTIVMDSKFEKETIEGIKIGDSFSSIKEKLGTPTFEKNDMIGYKTTGVYAFFYKDEIAIYPNENFNNSDIENLIIEYLEGNYTSRGRFSYDIVHKYLDFSSYIDESNTLNIKSAVRGINIKITEDGNMQVEIYNNYDITQKTKKLMRENIINTNFEEDLIYEEEKNRKK